MRNFGQTAVAIINASDLSNKIPLSALKSDKKIMLSVEEESVIYTNRTYSSDIFKVISSTQLNTATWAVSDT